MEKTRVMVYFSLFGNDFPINYVTETLEIEPSKTYKKGDAIVKPYNPNVMTTSVNYRKETVWEISTGYQESSDVKDQMSQLLMLLKNKETKINQLKDDYKLECQFSIVVIMENGYTPAFHLDKEQIEFANSIKAEFDVDLYANPYVGISDD